MVQKQPLDSNIICLHKSDQNINKSEKITISLNVTDSCTGVLIRATNTDLVNANVEYVVAPKAL